MLPLIPSNLKPSTLSTYGKKTNCKNRRAAHGQELEGSSGFSRSKEEARHGYLPCPVYL